MFSTWSQPPGIASVPETRKGTFHVMAGCAKPRVKHRLLYWILSSTKQRAYNNMHLPSYSTLHLHLPLRRPPTSRYNHIRLRGSIELRGKIPVRRRIRICAGAAVPLRLRNPPALRRGGSPSPLALMLVHLPML
jgi:hypothetical protein